MGSPRGRIGELVCLSPLVDDQNYNIWSSFEVILVIVAMVKIIFRFNSIDNVDDL